MRKKTKSENEQINSVISFNTTRDMKNELSRFDYIEKQLGNKSSICLIVRKACQEYIDNHKNYYNQKLMELLDV